MEIDRLAEEIKTFGEKTLADEIVWWIVNNVVNFISTETVNFSLSFLAHEEKMPEMARLEALCREIDTMEIDVTGDADQMMNELESNPEIEASAKMQQMVIDLLERVRLFLEDYEDGKKLVMDAFSFYHDFVGINVKTREEILRKLDGYVSFDYLSFENIESTLTKTPMNPVFDEEGRVIDYVRDESKKETLRMPPSFCIDFTVELWEDKGETSLF